MTFGTLAAAPHRTKQEFVYRTLRDAILRCELQPGERLVIDDLARRLNVSIIPVREALQLLQAESLVQVVPHVGTSVTPVSRDSIIDVFVVLEGLEVSATRLVAERGRAADLALLGGQVDAMEAALAANDREEWAALNRRFHLTISELPGLDMVKDLTGEGRSIAGIACAASTSRACSPTASSRPRKSTARSSRRCARATWPRSRAWCAATTRARSRRI